MTARRIVGVLDAYKSKKLSSSDAVEKLVKLLPKEIVRALRDEARVGWTPPLGFTAEQWRVVEETPVSQMMGHRD